MITLQNGDPMLSIWFGNFYQPAFDDMHYVDQTMELIRDLGFNCVELDSKAWEDFRDRYQGGEASQYVYAQEYMMQSAEKHGLQHFFLALYLNGDNLYPHIRFSPPIWGESVMNADGTDGRWYRYWSQKAQDSMVAHVQGLQLLYDRNQARIMENGVSKIPLCSMWDPIVAPSFDEEGRARYLQWLESHYQEIASLNKAYGIDLDRFEDLRKEDYWFACKYGDEMLYSQQDRETASPKFALWCDNMKWKRFELRRYFAQMQQRFAAFPQKLYLSPNMAQWGYFLNVDGSKLSGVGLANLWDTAMRGIDLYELTPYVDNCQFFTVPVTPAGDPDPYVVACQHSMMRCMNHGRDFMGGVFWGRFLYNDLYQSLTPCEIVGSIVASGAKGIWAYGINGLDDGGLLDRMNDGFLQSLQTANSWAKQVIPMLKGAPKTDVAILFPSAMAAFEPYSVPGADIHRMDLLGWYKACCDIGLCADVIDIGRIIKKGLENYKVLIIPHNSCYGIETNTLAEEVLSSWVGKGGILIHGPNDLLVQRSLGITPQPHEKDCAFFKEKLLLDGNVFCAYEGEEVLAYYLSDKAGCVVRNGNVYSFGFLYGASYTAKTTPHVPLQYRNEALYPVPLQKEGMLACITKKHLSSESILPEKGLEIVAFEVGMVIVNHTAHPICLSTVNGAKIFQYPTDQDMLLPHSAVFVSNQE